MGSDSITNGPGLENRGEQTNLPQKNRRTDQYDQVKIKGKRKLFLYFELHTVSNIWQCDS